MRISHYHVRAVVDWDYCSYLLLIISLAFFLYQSVFILDARDAGIFLSPLLLLISRLGKMSMHLCLINYRYVCGSG